MPPAGKALGAGSAFAEPVGRIGRQVAMAVDAARWPTDLDRVHPRGVAEAEVQSRIARRQEAAAARPLGEPATAARLERHPGPDRVAGRAGSCALELERREMAR